MEKIIKPISGFVALSIAVFLVIVSIIIFANANNETFFMVLGFLCIAIAIFILKGLLVISPNHSRVLNFFGKYVATVKENGLFFVNPFYTSVSISLRSNNLQGQILKVNDKMGNPIEIGAVIVWQVGDTYKAAYDVQNYDSYVKTQSEAAVRLLTGSFAYDNLEDENASITLREGGSKVNEILEKELSERLAPAGIIIKEARISHLAYASEIAGAMLQRQQATAIVAARTKIVEGAVGMVEMALNKLSERQIVDLDDDKKAAMVSNLLVVLCGERGATPIMNTGTLYQ
ncbi:SPFH domain-containing protein [Arachidicoccus sp.]|uniref:SPFH domain-containing protein n=1 Tax=Arachidicoccus sp. TaxID=1872624 RepID=UPI003D21D3AF